MASRLKIVAIFLLFSIALVLSSKNSGNTPKKKPSPPNLSDNIDNNPFLHNFNTSGSVSYDSNLFLANKAEAPLLRYGNGIEKNETSVNNKRSEATENRSIGVAVFIRNPFLQAGPSENNLTQVVPLKSSEATPKIGARILVDDVPYNTNLYTDTKTKSEIKCEEYARQILGTTDVLSLVGTSREVVKIPNKKCTNMNRLVVGGINASPREFPHMVALGIRDLDGTFSFSCGGSLIAPEWVLTAAHCTYGPRSPTEARIGLQHLSDNQNGIRTTINKVIRHPSYNPPVVYADIALMKLNTVVAFNEKIKPACLYQQYDTVPTHAWVTGWGLTEFGGEQSDQLQETVLEITDSIACAIKYNQSTSLPYGIAPSMICAGDPRGGWTKDTCQGDSGGPLQIAHPNNLCLYQVVGITSFGLGCALINTPGVYTRVSHYLNWIEDIVWP